MTLNFMNENDDKLESNTAVVVVGRRPSLTACKFQSTKVEAVEEEEDDDDEEEEEANEAHRRQDEAKVSRRLYTLQDLLRNEERQIESSRDFEAKQVQRAIKESRMFRSNRSQIKFKYDSVNRQHLDGIFRHQTATSATLLTIFIYTIFTLSNISPADGSPNSHSTSYWPSPLRRPFQLRNPMSLRAHFTQNQQQSTHNQEDPIVADFNQPSVEQSRQETSQVSAPAQRQLMIGEHYNNISSIVPYSIVQDADYPNQALEDPLLDEFQQDQMSESGTNSRVEGESLMQTAPALKSRALLPLDSSRLMLPQMQQIKSRFNQGCVGGTKCQFFAFCWMTGGSLGASCGLLMTCCVTPSRQEIQPGFFGPVVNDPYCGRSTSKINRIVGGTDASFGQFPWQAFVQVGGSRCGGALISSRHVVTAGHCVARSQHSPSSIKVTLGDYILNSDIESIPHEVFTVVEVMLHPNFRFTPQADRYDVAVLELDRPVNYKDNIKPICLPQKDATFVGRVAYVAGWGALQAGSKLRPKVLQHVAVPVIENQVCESWHRRKGIDIRIYDEMMCAGYELGQRDACQGDSGGPLMLNQFGVWYLVGIVSAGYSCAKQYQPGIYHRVSSSSDWISSNVYQQGSNR